MKVKPCCGKIVNEYQYEVRRNGRIDLAFDDSHYNQNNVKFCMYCGKELELEQ